MNRNHYLKDIVEIARDGAQFYDDAQQHVQDAGLRTTFAQMASAKRELIAGLSARLRAEGAEPPRNGTIAGAIRKTYTDVAAKLSKHEARLYVGQLEETEDRLIAEVRKAIADCEDAGARSVLEAYWPKVKASHEQMRKLKHSLAA
ncbi:PA2169 family four-helix-bundle protein [Solimonas soli]|uniref:PA2169 family four-helix-bundle protein n=1 Tax=Solimonas soli TaxID=413479 RepID=UPI00047F85FB|nr:PA2169 family four-helix-bundle protein [Solimonas soli]